MKYGVKKVVLIGVLISAALIFSYVEFLFPSFIPVPGVKLGLANIVVLLAMLILGIKEAFLVGILRVILSSILFGNFISFFMAVSGFLLSFLFMAYLYKMDRNSIPGISMGGGVFHNFGQLIAASVYIGNFGLFKWAFLFSLFGIITGLITGFICRMIYERVKEYDWLSSR